YEIFNGLGENVLAYDQGDNVVDGAPWIQRDWIERDSSGRVSTRVRHSLFFDDPFTVADTAAPVSSSAGRLWSQYDPFGRATYDYSDTKILGHYTYRPLEVEIRDAEQVIPGGRHQNAYAVVKFDGHGRRTATSWKGDGDEVEREIDYLGTGEPRIIKTRHA